jgi:hypothetical protein
MCLKNDDAINTSKSRNSEALKRHLQTFIKIKNGEEHIVKAIKELE